MDAQNYVGPDPTDPGKYLVVVNGSVDRGYDLAAAQDLFNRLTSQPSTGITAPAAVAPAPAAGSISPEHREGLRTAGYGDWANPNLTEADWTRIAQGARTASGQVAGSTGAGGDSAFPWMEYFNQGAESLKLQALYNQNMIKYQNDRLAFDKTVQEWSEGFKTGELLGNYQGRPTLGALNLVASLRGPESAFNQQAVLHGLNPQGVSNAVDAIAGRSTTSGFQAPQAQARPVTLDSLYQQMGYGAPGQPGAAPAPGTAPVPGAPPASNPAPGVWALPQGFDWGGTQSGWDSWANQVYQQTGQWATPAEFLSKIQASIPGAPASYAQALLDRLNQNNRDWGHMGLNRADVSYPNPEQQPNWLQTVYDAWAPTQQVPAPATAAPATTAPATGFTAPPATGPNGALTVQDAYANALVNPNRIVGRNWVKLPSDTKSFLTGAYETLKGYSANDIADAIQRGLPQFRAPSVGTVA